MPPGPTNSADYLRRNGSSLLRACSNIAGSFANVAIEPDVGTGFIATLHDDSTVDVSRRQAQALKARMSLLE